jgi:hypothetical protein
MDTNGIPNHLILRLTSHFQNALLTKFPIIAPTKKANTSPPKNIIQVRLLITLFDNGWADR